MPLIFFAYLYGDIRDYPGNIRDYIYLRHTYPVLSLKYPRDILKSRISSICIRSAGYFRYVYSNIRSGYFLISVNSGSRILYTAALGYWQYSRIYGNIMIFFSLRILDLFTLCCLCLGLHS